MGGLESEGVSALGTVPRENNGEIKTISLWIFIRELLWHVLTRRCQHQFLQTALKLMNN